MSKTPVEIALEYFRCQHKGDLAGIEALLAPDFEARTPWGLKTRAEALKAWGDGMAKPRPNSVQTVRNVEEISHGGVLIELTALIELGDEVIEFDVCDVIKMKDGRIASLHAYFDRTRIEQHLAKFAANSAAPKSETA